ncbi:MAG TPA: hypothetical protein VEX13_01400 [Chloroflexia bacterium]|nr:hypothetical protein [Chloroflexia bacterium]
MLDLFPMLAEMRRVLKPGRKAVLVIGNSYIKGVYVNNAEILLAVAQQVGFAAAGRWDRELPPNRRYLPPPGEKSGTGLEKRMRTESVLTCLRQ